MPKKTKGQFDHYKKWTTDEGYTFVAETNIEGAGQLCLDCYDEIYVGVKRAKRNRKNKKWNLWNI